MPVALSVAPAPGLVERQAREGRHSGAGVDGGGASKCRPVGVVGQCQCDAGGEVGGDVSERILGRDDESEAASGGDASWRRGRQHELARRRGVDGDGTGRRGAQSGAGCLKRGASPGLVERQAREGRHSGAGVDGEGASEGRRVGVVGQCQGHAPGEVRVDVPEWVLGRDDESEPTSGGDAAWWRSRHHELARRRGRDGDGTGRRGAQPCSGRPERGACPSLVERQAGEGRHSGAGVDGGGASKCRRRWGCWPVPV